MSVIVNEDLTRATAKLARLELSPAEVTEYTAQLGKILAYVEQLSAVPVAAVEPMFHPFDPPTPWRADEDRRFPLTAEGRPRVLECAPVANETAFEVPPIL